MSGSGYYPPGHPTGVDHGRVEMVCESAQCGESWASEYENDRETGAFEVMEPVCPSCGSDGIAGEEID